MTIATYGGSYCFCNDVDDHETFQHYLAENLNVSVSNYGVGNYGLGQAVKRLKRRYHEDPADYVIMTYTSNALPHILGTWKYYYDFKNTFAVKPRYKHNNNGDLVEIPCVIEKRDELLNLQQYADTLRENDYHYNNWYLKNKKPALPYTLYWTKNPNQLAYAMCAGTEYLTRKVDLLEPIHSILEDARAQTQNNAKPNKLEYKKSLSMEFADLYCDILTEFASFVSDQGSTPMYLPLYNSSLIRHELENEPIDSHIIREIKQSDTEIVVLDEIRNNLVDNVDELSKLYVRSDPIGGHHSPEANKMIAEQLETIIQSRKNNRSQNPE